jgi:CheY-like chemotaxis protein
VKAVAQAAHSLRRREQSAQLKHLSCLKDALYSSLAAGRLFAKDQSMSMPFRSKSILLLDADRRTSQRLAGLLEEDGFRVEVLHDGASAMARLSHQPWPDTLITELNLPITDGAKVARFALSHSPSLRLIILTRYPNLAEPQVLGVTRPTVLTKPLDYPALLELLSGKPVTSTVRRRVASAVH